MNYFLASSLRFTTWTNLFTNYEDTKRKGIGYVRKSVQRSLLIAMLPSIEQDVATKEINAPPSSPLKELPDVYLLSRFCESFQVVMSTSGKLYEKYYYSPAENCDGCNSKSNDITDSSFIFSDRRSIVSLEGCRDEGAAYGAEAEKGEAQGISRTPGEVGGTSSSSWKWSSACSPMWQPLHTERVADMRT